MDRTVLLSRLAQPAKSRIVLLVVDGIGDLRCPTQPATPLERANLPHLDDLARRSSLGRLTPVAGGVTPGSGPGHLALFGYDTSAPQAAIGRGVLEALGLGLELEPGVVAARGNFATADQAGNLVDRRAGRISSAECEALCARLQDAVSRLADADEAGRGLEILVRPGEGHRFVFLLRGEGLSPAIADTDPQRLGVAPLPLMAESPQARSTVARLDRALQTMQAAIAQEPKANRILLRGFSALPQLPSLEELYKIRCGAFAGYPLYRGVASAVGMEILNCGKTFVEVLESVAREWQRFDFFFLHVKQTDMAGEDGDLVAKTRALEEVDQELPKLLELEPDVLAITGDHSTPVPMRGHSWHPVPLLLHSATSFVDDCCNFTELAAIQGCLGLFKASELMGQLLAHAGRLAKFGA